jgi:signal transduction histidine kinase
VTVGFEVSRDDQARRMARAATTLLAIEHLQRTVQLMATATEAEVHGDRAWHDLAGREGLARVRPALDGLAALVAEEPLLQTGFAHLRPQVLALAETAEQAATALAGGRTGEALRLAEGLGPAALERFDAEIGQLQALEQAALQRRELSWRHRALIGFGVAAAATVALGLLLVLAARIVRSEMRERERLSGELAELVEVQQQLMAIVGHDLRNPLAAMKGSAALLSHAHDLPDAHQEHASRILSNARRMERLLRDLLDFTRVRVGVGLPMAPMEANLVDLSRRAVSDLGRDAEGRVTVEGRGDVGGVWDPDRLEQVVANLVSNALKYGPALRPVRVVVDGLRDDVVLSVSNEGEGLSPDQAARLFEPYQRGRSGDDQEGRSVGLGLFVVRRIAEVHGGAAWVETEPGRGTTFTVRLPRGRAPAAAAPAAGG